MLMGYSSLILDFSVDFKGKWVFLSIRISCLSCNLNFPTLLLNQMWCQDFNILHSLHKCVNFWVGFNKLEVLNFIVEGTTSKTSCSFKNYNNRDVNHHWIFVFVHPTMWSFVSCNKLFSLDKEVFVS